MTSVDEARSGSSQDFTDDESEEEKKEDEVPTETDDEQPGQGNFVQAYIENNPEGFTSKQLSDESIGIEVKMQKSKTMTVELLDESLSEDQSNSNSNRVTIANFSKM